MNHEILLGLTTTPRSDWRGKVDEMKKFGIKRIALFPTFLEIEDRRELYKLLDEIDGLEIPHIHLRQEDMEEWEMKWFESHGARAYNIHAVEVTNEVFLPYLNKIFIENHPDSIIPKKYLENSAGLCLDFQHFNHSKRKFPEVALSHEGYAKEFTIGCCHLSAEPKWQYKLCRMIKGSGKHADDGHYMMSLSEMDYLLDFTDYFPEFMSIELENSFKRQLEVKAYLEKILAI